MGQHTWPNTHCFYCLYFNTLLKAIFSLVFGNLTQWIASIVTLFPAPPRSSFTFLTTQHHVLCLFPLTPPQERNPPSPFSTAQILLDVGPALECDQRCYSVKKTILALSRQSSNANTSSTRTELSYPPHCHVPGFLTDLSMSRSCECCQNLWVHVCTAPLCLKPLFLASSTASGSVWPSCTLLPKPWGEGCAVDIPSICDNTSRLCGVRLFCSDLSVTQSRARLCRSGLPVAASQCCCAAKAVVDNVYPSSHHCSNRVSFIDPEIWVKIM